MALCSVNEIPAAQAKVSLPRIGVWHADVVLATDDNVTGSVTLTVGDLSLKGTVFRGGQYVGGTYLRVVGGAGGMGKEARPKHYKDFVLVRSVLSDLMSDSGESLSLSTSASFLGGQLSNWATLQLPVAAVLDDLIKRIEPGAAWRMGNDGTLLVQTDSYPELSLDAAIQDEHPQLGRVMLALDSPSLEPGVTLLGKKIGYVVHEIDGKSSRTSAWIDA